MDFNDLKIESFSIHNNSSRNWKYSHPIQDLHLQSTNYADILLFFYNLNQVIFFNHFSQQSSVLQTDEIDWKFLNSERFENNEIIWSILIPTVDYVTKCDALHSNQSGFLTLRNRREILHLPSDAIVASRSSHSRGTTNHQAWTSHWSFFNLLTHNPIRIQRWRRFSMSSTETCHTSTLVNHHQSFLSLSTESGKSNSQESSIIQNEYASQFFQKNKRKSFISSSQAKNADMINRQKMEHPKRSSSTISKWNVHVKRKIRSTSSTLINFLFLRFHFSKT